MNRLNKKFRNYIKLSDYSGLIPHYNIKVSVIIILSGICISSVYLLDSLIFGEMMAFKFFSINSTERLIIALIALIASIIVMFFVLNILQIIEEWEKENKEESKRNSKAKSKKKISNFFEKDKVNYQIPKSSSIKKNQDIFTIKISNNDPLWRVRAYIIGFLLADGTIRTQPYEISATQKDRDKDILVNIQKALGGKINGPDEKNKYHLKAYRKELILRLLELGMVKAHSKKEIAVRIQPPNFIMKKIFGQSLVRDFVRGYFDGDGWFTGSFLRGDTSFKIIGPLNFLNTLKQLILNEIQGLTGFITNERKQYYIVNRNKYQLFSKLTIYKRGYGYYRLTPLDLEKGEIKTLDHPWLKVLHFGGNLNSIRFFNWLYENNDQFNEFKIKGIRICGERKFKKALDQLGNARFRREKLAPNWKDVLFDMVQQMQHRLYKTQELIDLTNGKLILKLDSLNLDYLYDVNKVQNRDKFVERLKFLEYLDNLLISYRYGRDNFYYSKLNPKMEFPSYFTRNIDLVDKNGIKRNIKNLIVLIIIEKENSSKFSEILSELRNRGIFHKHSYTPKNIKLFLAQLKSFDIIIAVNGKKELDKQRFIINTSVIQKYYNLNAESLKKELNNLFS